jgi:hypothetical protein
LGGVNRSWEEMKKSVEKSEKNGKNGKKTKPN